MCGLEAVHWSVGFRGPERRAGQVNRPAALFSLSRVWNRADWCWEA
jgi:hypothetical protein